MEEFFTDNIGLHFSSAVQAGQVRFHQCINPETALKKIKRCINCPVCGGGVAKNMFWRSELGIWIVLDLSSTLLSVFAHVQLPQCIYMAMLVV